MAPPDETDPAPVPSDPDDGDRRRFLARLTMGIGAGLGAVLVVPWLGLFLSPVRRREPPIWREVGGLDDFPVGETIQVSYRDPAPLPWAGFAARSSAWVRRESDGDFSAFTSYCTHVGCPVRWEADARLFMCPCHGGAFYEDGTVAAGPPPRPLDRFPIRVREGRVELRPLGIPEPEGG